jgi:hypothetical protein
MAMETVKGMATARLAAVAHLFEPQNERALRLATKKHKKHKRFSKTILCFLCFFVASFLLRGGFSLLFFVETFLIFLDPGFEIVRGFLELVAVQ